MSDQPPSYKNIFMTELEGDQVAKSRYIKEKNIAEAKAKKEAKIERIKQANINKIVGRAIDELNKVMALIEERKRNPLTRKEQSKIDKIVGYRILAEEATDERIRGDYIRVVTGILQAESQRIRDAVNNHHLYGDYEETAANLKEFINTQDADEMMRFAQHYNITLEQP